MVRMSTFVLNAHEDLLFCKCNSQDYEAYINKYLRKKGAYL